MPLKLSKTKYDKLKQLPAEMLPPAIRAAVREYEIDHTPMAGSNMDALRSQAQTHMEEQERERAIRKLPESQQAILRQWETTPDRLQAEGDAFHAVGDKRNRAQEMRRQRLEGGPGMSRAEEERQADIRRQADALIQERHKDDSALGAATRQFARGVGQGLSSTMAGAAEIGDAMGSYLGRPDSRTSDFWRTSDTSQRAAELERQRLAETTGDFVSKVPGALGSSAQYMINPAIGVGTGAMSGFDTGAQNIENYRGNLGYGQAFAQLAGQGVLGAGEAMLGPGGAMKGSGGFMRRRLMDMGGEAIEEAGQTALGQALDYATDMGGERDKTMGQRGMEILEAGGLGAITGGIVQSPGAVAEFVATPSRNKMNKAFEEVRNAGPVGPEVQKILDAHKTKKDMPKSVDGRQKLARQMSEAYAKDSQAAQLAAHTEKVLPKAAELSDYGLPLPEAGVADMTKQKDPWTTPAGHRPTLPKEGVTGEVQAETALEDFDPADVKAQNEQALQSMGIERHYVGKERADKTLTRETPKELLSKKFQPLQESFNEWFDAAEMATPEFWEGLARVAEGGEKGTKALGPEEQSFVSDYGLDKEGGFASLLKNADRRKQLSTWAQLKLQEITGKDTVGTEGLPSTVGSASKGVYITAPSISEIVQSDKNLKRLLGPKERLVGAQKLMHEVYDFFNTAIGGRLPEIDISKRDPKDLPDLIKKAADAKAMLAIKDAGLENLVENVERETSGKDVVGKKDVGQGQFVIKPEGAVEVGKIYGDSILEMANAVRDKGDVTGDMPGAGPIFQHATPKTRKILHDTLINMAVDVYNQIGVTMGVDSQGNPIGSGSLGRVAAPTADARQGQDGADIQYGDPSKVAMEAEAQKRLDLTPKQQAEAESTLAAELKDRLGLDAGESASVADALGRAPRVEQPAKPTPEPSTPEPSAGAQDPVAPAAEGDVQRREAALEERAEKLSDAQITKKRQRLLDAAMDTYVNDPTPKNAKRLDDVMDQIQRIDKAAKLREEQMEVDAEREKRIADNKKTIERLDKEIARMDKKAAKAKEEAEKVTEDPEVTAPIEESVDELEDQLDTRETVDEGQQELEEELTEVGEEEVPRQDEEGIKSIADAVVQLKKDGMSWNDAFEIAAVDLHPEDVKLVKKDIASRTKKEQKPAESKKKVLSKKQAELKASSTKAKAKKARLKKEAKKAKFDQTLSDLDAEIADIKAGKAEPRDIGAQQAPQTIDPGDPEGMAEMFNKDAGRWLNKVSTPIRTAIRKKGSTEVGRNFKDTHEHVAQQVDRLLDSGDPKTINRAAADKLMTVSQSAYSAAEPADKAGFDTMFSQMAAADSIFVKLSENRDKLSSEQRKRLSEIAVQRQAFRSQVSAVLGYGRASTFGYTPESQSAMFRMSIHPDLKVADQRIKEYVEWLKKQKSWQGSKMGWKALVMADFGKGVAREITREVEKNFGEPSFMSMLAKYPETANLIHKSFGNWNKFYEQRNLGRATETQTMLTSAMYSGQLGGLGTQAVNLVGSPIHWAKMDFDDGLAKMTEAVLKKDYKGVFSAMGGYFPILGKDTFSRKMIREMVDNRRDIFRAARRTWAMGMGIADVGSKTATGRTLHAGEQQGTDNPFAGGNLKRALAYATRGLQFIDTVYKTAAIAAQMREETGKVDLSGPNIADKVAEKNWERHTQKGQERTLELLPEGTLGEKFVAGVSSGMSKRFRINPEPETKAEQMKNWGKQLSNFTADFVKMRYMPYVRIPLNVAISGLDLVPGIRHVNRMGEYKGLSFADGVKKTAVESIALGLVLGTATMLAKTMLGVDDEELDGFEKYQKTVVAPTGGAPGSIELPGGDTEVDTIRMFGEFQLPFMVAMQVGAGDPVGAFNNFVTGVAELPMASGVQNVLKDTQKAIRTAEKEGELEASKEYLSNLVLDAVYQTTIANNTVRDATQAVTGEWRSSKMEQKGTFIEPVLPGRYSQTDSVAGAVASGLGLQVKDKSRMEKLPAGLRNFVAVWANDPKEDLDPAKWNSTRERELKKLGATSEDLKAFREAGYKKLVQKTAAYSNTTYLRNVTEKRVRSIKEDVMDAAMKGLPEALKKKYEDKKKAESKARSEAKKAKRSTM